ncbi:PKD domain-containing protein [Massilia sp. DWR3-1-1]|uniref:PKD domain-containing protein n=1 Tax=Massilia sp. DWR3-1-1 TaxID=2804559 RepID=UPI003CF20AC0
MAGATLAVQVAPVRAQGGVAAAATTAAAAAVRYRVVNLGPGSLTRLPVINASGQVAFSLYDAGLPLAWFFDGKRVLGLGTLGGSSAYASGINDRGQVTGFSTRDDGAVPRYGAFRWSAASGMLDLGTFDGGNAEGSAINHLGEVVGNAGGALRPVRAFRWNATSGLEDLGTLSTDLSAALALNDSGLVAGFSNAADGFAHSFVWTRSGGIEDIGTLGGLFSYPQAVGARGEVAGYSDTPAGRYHAYFWTRAAGMRDLGTLNGTESFVLAMSRQAQIAGVINLDSGYQRAISWTASTGMLDLGTLGGSGSRAASVNNQGQVVGWAHDSRQAMRAFTWTRAQGLADLNARLVNAPAGLVLESAEAVADNGTIVASSNAGLVLLRPLGQATLGAPVVGPIQAPALVRAGAAATLRVAFNDIDTRDSHRVTLDWGDATLETALVTERGVAGSASATHRYREPGVYGITARVIDSAGNTTTVRRDVVVEGASQRAAGSGRVLAPLGADRHAPDQAGVATFSFVAPAAQAGSGQLSFTTTRLLFRSDSMSATSATGATGATGAARGGQQLSELSGVGRLNGKHGYRYTLVVAAAPAGGQGTFSLRIWHSDPVSGADVVDFDNARTSAAAHATAVTEGAIAVAP